MCQVNKTLDTFLLHLQLLVLACQITLAENHISNLCPSGVTSNQWNYKNPSVQVKNWIKSVVDEDYKCPYASITEMKHFGARFSFCFTNSRMHFGNVTFQIRAKVPILSQNLIFNLKFTFRKLHF